MAKEKEPTKEEKEKAQAAKKEKDREVALSNLGATNLVDIGTAYLVSKTKEYGEFDNAAMEQYKYFPAFSNGIKAYDKNGEEFDVLQNSILASREEGERYSGNISERKVMQECAAIMSESLNSVKFSDLIKLMNYEGQLKDKYKDAYISDLAPKRMTQEQYNALSPEEKKKQNEAKELYQKVIASYQTYLTQTKVSEALAESAKEISKKGLEEILVEPEKKKGEGDNDK